MRINFRDGCLLDSFVKTSKCKQDVLKTPERPFGHNNGFQLSFILSLPAVRRVPHSRGVGGSTRPRRSAHSTSHQSSTSSIVTTLTPSLAAAAAAAASAARDSIDPIAELLSQLTSVRRSIPSTSSAQVQQQIQMQLERERLEQRAQAMRSASRPAFSSVVANSMSSTLANNSGSGNNGARSSGNITGGGSSSIHFPLYSYVSNRSGTGVNNDTGNTSAAAPGANQGSSTTGQFLLRQLSDDEGPSDGLSESARRKSQFVQELLLSTLWSGQQTEPNDGKDPKLTKVQKDRKFSWNELFESLMSFNFHLVCLLVFIVPLTLTLL